MIIRQASIHDLNAIAELEQLCFPEAEAATRESFEKRLQAFPNHFWLLTEEEQIIALVNGMVTDMPLLTDAMYENANMHDENGAWQMIFGVETHPDYQKHGYAAMLLKHVIEETRMQGRKGLVLTCKEKLIPFYSKLGFENEGVSASVHGGVMWYDMRLTF